MTTTKSRVNPNWTDTERAVREHEGKIVGVITHLLSHMSSTQDMLCAGRIESGYLFINSVREELDGKKKVLGIIGNDEGNTSYDGYNNFCLYNFAAAQHPFTVLHLEGKEYSRALKLWESREK